MAVYVTIGNKRIEVQPIVVKVEPAA